MTATTTTRTNYVVYSPRGFRNEIAVKTFESKAEAAAFGSEVNNEADSYTFNATETLYKQAIRKYRKAIAQYGNDADYLSRPIFGYEA